MTYLSCLLTVILMLCLSKGQQIYFQNFTSLCTYINTSLPSSVTRFNNYQGQFYRLDNVTNQVKVVYDTLSSNCYLAVFQQNTSSITCRDFSLFAGNSYQLQFDHTFSFQLNSTLNVHWNADEIYTINYLLNSSFIEGIFQHVLVYLPAIVNTNNRLCFSGTSINNGTAKGPCIDNLNITLTGTAPALTPTPTPTPNSTNSTNGSSSLIIPTQNNSAVQQQPKIESYPQLAFIKQFGLSFNQISDAISFFGFSYLISNLLNFWNIIVLYYFLKLNTFIPSYRNQLLQLCSISMQQGSIFSLVHQALDNNKAQIPKKDYQKIPSSQSEWPSFNELGFTSQILLNNVETYFNLFNCIFKIFSVKIIIKLIKKRKCCASKIVSGFNVPFLDVFCYQILCSSPGMIIPFAIMSSSNSQLGFQSFDEKTNNMIHALSVQLFIICLLIPLLNKKLPKVIRPKPKEEKDQNKSILQIQSVKLTSKIDMTQTQMTRANSTYKVAVSNKQKQFIAYTKKMTTYSKQMRQKRFIFCDTVLETQNHLLFFCIPFFIGLQSLPIFFIVNIIVLSMAVVVEWKNRQIIKQFKRIQYYFGILMKFVMLVIHIFFIVVYLNQLNIIRLTIQSMSFISLTSILLIIVGALIQIMHTVVLFFVWVYEFGKKIKQNFCIKARISSQPLTKQKARTIKSTYHQRPTKGIQNIEISSVNSKDSLTQIKLAGLQKGKQNTRRISNKNNPNFIKNRANIFNNVNQLKDSEQELKKVQMKNIK